MRKNLFLFGLVLGLNFMANFCRADVIWEKAERLTVDSADSTAAAIAADSRNQIHAVWRDTRDLFRGEIYYKHSLDGGRSWEPDVRLTEDVNFSQSPDIAADGQDGVHIVWMDDRDNGVNEVYYKQSPDGGETWKPDMHLTAADNYSSQSPAIATDSKKRIHVVWADDRDNTTNYEIYYTRSLDGGETWEPAVRLTNDDKYTYSPAIAADSQDGVHLVWSDSYQSDSQIYYQRSVDGGQTWEPAVSLTMDSAYTRIPTITTDPKNRVHVAWGDNRPTGESEIYYKRSVDAGETWQKELRLTTDHAVSQFPSIAADSRDRVHVVWYGDLDGNPEIYYKRSVDAGETWLGDTRLTTQSAVSAYPAIAADPKSRLHVVWDDDRDGNQEIYYQRGRQELEMVFRFSEY